MPDHLAMPMYMIMAKSSHHNCELLIMVILYVYMVCIHIHTSVYSCILAYLYTYVCTLIPYSGLLSPGANFREFPKWTHNSIKFILGCCIKFNYGSLVEELGATVIFLKY